MAVTVTSSITGPYIPNGAATVFAFDFKAGSADELDVYRDQGDRWVLVPGADYTASVDPEQEGGTIEFSVAPAVGSGDLYIVSEPLFTREGQYTGEGPFTPKGLNSQFDKAAVRDLALKRDVDRSIKVPLGEDADLTLPGSALRSSRYLMFSPDGKKLITSSGTGTDAGLRQDLADVLGADIPGFSHEEDYRQGSLGAKEQVRVCVEDFPFLARSTLLIDSRAAFVQACQFVADSGGGVVEAPGVYYCSDDIEVPNGVTIEGQVRAAEIGISGSPFAFGTRRSRISLSAGKHIILRNWSGLKGLIIHRHGLAVGEDPNTWTGTAVLVRGAGTVQDDLVVLGFAKWCDATSSVDGERCSRLRASRVLLDCQAGISISYCYDIPYLYEIHGNALTGTTTLLRNGIGIDFNTDVDWPRATNCFFYGYATGIRVNSANDAILTNCGTDYVPGEASTSDGVLVSGTARCCKLIGHQAAAQGAGIKVDNGAAYQPVVVVIGASFWANDTDGIRVISGNLICVASTFLDGARAIRVDDTNTAATASVHITQCLFKGVAAALTIPDAVLNASHIADNHFINCADATIGSVHTFAAGVRDATTFRSFNATAVGPRTIQDHARGTAAAPVIVNDGDQTFSLIGRAWTGAAWAAGGQVRGQVTGAPSTTSMPARLIFSTVPVGAIVATDRWNMTTAGHFEPIAGNAYALGSNSLPVSNIYSQNAVTVVSDERAKTDITDSTLGLAFINALRPVSYRQKVGAQIVVGQDYCDLFGNPVEDPGVDDVPGELIIENRPGVRRHFGLIAQDVKALIDAAGVDFGGFVMEDPDDPESRQALRYEQFIAPLIKAVQELSAQNLALTDRVAGLEAANA